MNFLQTSVRRVAILCCAFTTAILQALGFSEGLRYSAPFPTQTKAELNTWGSPDVHELEFLSALTSWLGAMGTVVLEDLQIPGVVVTATEGDSQSSVECLSPPVH